MKKIVCLLLSVFFFGQANAQVLRIAEKPVMGSKLKAEPQVLPVINHDAKEVKEDAPVNEKELEKIIKEIEDIPPTEVTEEERAALRIEAKKDIQKTIQNRNARDRRGIVDAMNYVEKMKARQEAILQGLPERDVEEAEAKVEMPKFNPLNDDAIQEYLFEQNGLNATKKTDSDNENSNE